MSLENLNNPLFENDDSREAFKEILKTLVYIKPVFVERKEFDSLNWAFLKESWEDKFWNKYNLYLPKDLNNKDLFHIVFLLNEKFSLWLDIQKFIWYVRLWTRDLSPKQISKLKKENEEKIERIILENSLHEDSFSKYQKELEANSFSLRKSIREIKDYSNQKNWTSKKIKLKDVDNLDSLLEILYTWEFDLSFFRKSRDMLRYGLMTLTRKEFKEIKSRLRRVGEKFATSRVALKDLDIREQKLREKIWIDELKKELEEARKNNDKKLITELERKAVDKILHIIYSTYPYQITLENYWYQPSKVLEFKEMYCVWFSLVWHSFLYELWIRHNWLCSPRHSALEIFLWNKSYYFDNNSNPKLYELKWWNSVKNDHNFWFYKEFSNIWDNIAVSWNPEKILLSQIISNKSVSLHNEENYDLVKYIFKRAVNLNPICADIYFWNWLCSFDRWNYEESIEMYNSSLELNPSFAEFYYEKWISLYKLKRKKESSLNLFVNELFKNWKYSFSIFDFLYRKEKKEIRKLFARKDYEWIRLYLLSIENS